MWQTLWTCQTCSFSHVVMSNERAKCLKHWYIQRKWSQYVFWRGPFLRCLHTINNYFICLIEIEITDSVQIRLRAYLSVHAIHLFCYNYLLFRSYFTLSNAMQITFPLTALVRVNKRVRIGIYLYSHFVIWKKLIFWRTLIFTRLIFAWSYFRRCKFCHILYFA